MCEKCTRICNAIGELVAAELSRVTIINQNPDFDGPNQIIEVSGQWSDLEIRTIEGDDLLECLESAVAAKRETAEDKPPGPPDPPSGGPMPRWGDDTEQPKPQKRDR